MASTSATAPGAARGPDAATPLPLAAPSGRRERADAARNRAQVLTVAQRLFASRDIRTVSMDEIAKAAGVGRATLYRRFPDVRSIAVALLDQHERELQGQLLRGEPPLGPGAAPVDRLVAFYRAMVDLLERGGHLVLGVEAGSARFGSGAYLFWRAHVRLLLTEAGVPEPGLADVLLAPVAAELYLYQRRTLGLGCDEIGDQLVWLAQRTLGSHREDRHRTHTE